MRAFVRPRRGDHPAFRTAIYVAVLGLGSTLRPSSVVGQTEAKIQVSPNVHLSAADPRRNYVEVVADADPRNPNLLIACSMVESRPLPRIQSAAYISSDGGKSWAKGVETPRGAWDPDCHVGTDGTMYFSANWNAPEPGAARGVNTVQVLLYRSKDGGKTWDAAREIPGSIDRQWMGVDPSRPQRLYLYYATDIGSYDGKKTMGIQLISSDDGGASFGGRVTSLMPTVDADLDMARPVVLSDGTLVIMIGRILAPDPAVARASHEGFFQGNPLDGEMIVLLSHDGGKTLEAPIRIAAIAAAQAPNNRVIATIAADPGSQPFKDRLYAVWPDQRSGRSEIMESHSADSGKTWSRPKVIGDDQPFEGRPGPDDFQANVAVNRAGVVGVMWYDRRGILDNTGYNVRFSASLDGGDTWSPSVLVSEKPSRFEADQFEDIWLDLAQPKASEPDGIRAEFSINTWEIGGHTAGIAAAADGTFMPVWVDNRTRYQQLWTSKVTVTGTVTKNGSAELATFEDVSHEVGFEMGEISFDRTTGILTTNGRLKNIGKQVLRGPLKARLITLRSEYGALSVRTSDNGIKGAGAIWDFSSVIPPQGLAPGAMSGPKPIAFQVTGLRSRLVNGKYNLGSLIAIEARVLRPRQ